MNTKRFYFIFWLLCKFLLIIIISFVGVPSKAGDHDESIGVEIAFLEDWCERSSERGELKLEYKPRVRLAFKLKENGWEPFDYSVSGVEELRQAAKRFAAKRKWFLVEKETVLDSLMSEGVKEYKGYVNVGTQKIVEPLPSSALLPRGSKFLGWTGCEVRRPIVLTTSKPQKGKENWEKIQSSFTPNQEFVDKINNFSTKLYTCKDERDENGVTLKAVIRIDMLETVEELRSDKGDRLIAIRFREDACVADNTLEFEDSIYWFLRKANSSLKFVGQGLALIDMADYDLDGNTEFLFWHNGYNLNGYRILWRNLTKIATVSWSYH